ncbi:MAG TPA: MarR family transcriptional regulator [Candidatus Angelobacter sp.]|nr:MarR family transcriptional regulator [Candidatus Angelobacter sp.]
MQLSTSPSLDFCIGLAKASAALSRRLDGHLGTLHGLSFGDFALLLQLGRAPQGKLRRVDLAETLGLTASAVTRALIPLEKIGLVTRERDVHDARVGYAALTRSGRRILEQSLVTAQAVSADGVRDINAESLRWLVELMDGLSSK